MSKFLFLSGWGQDPTPGASFCELLGGDIQEVDYLRNDSFEAKTFLPYLEESR